MRLYSGVLSDYTKTAYIGLMGEISPPNNKLGVRYL